MDTAKFLDKIGDEIERTFEPSVDIANATIQFSVQRCSDLHLQPILCMMLIGELANHNAKMLIAERQEAVDKQIETHFPGLTKRPEIEKLDLYEEMQKVLAAMMKDLKLGEKEL